MTNPAEDLPSTPAGGVGSAAARPDAAAKIRGEYRYASDLRAEGMLWGATARSPHPFARIVAADIRPALAVDGVRAVLTADDVPGENRFGLDIADQPVLADGIVRYRGEPVALVAADDLDTARRAAELIRVEYELWKPVTDAWVALGHRPHVAGEPVPRLHPGGNLVRHLRLRRGERNPVAPVVVAGEYEIAMQDQAFLGPESGLAVPTDDGSIDLHVATQWLHGDRRQLGPILDLPEDKLLLTLAGVGGAFGGREDLSVQAHACLLAMRTGRPVKMVYSREESFVGHVHRHPAVIRFEHGADMDGRLVYVRADIHLDGGAYASSSRWVVGNVGTMVAGPYSVPNVSADVWGAYTNNPPCGAMRGFGAVQLAFAHEAQMDLLATRLDMDPVELRCLNALHEGSSTPSGQLVDSPAPVAELLRCLRAMPLPDVRQGRLNGQDVERPHPPRRTSMTVNTTPGESTVRGVGYAVAYKNVGFSEGTDDFSTARVRLQLQDGSPMAIVHTAAAEVGQGIVTIEQQIARTELAVERVVLHPKDTSVGSSGPSSASRQSYVTGGAVRAACAAVRDAILRRANCRSDCHELGDLRLDSGRVRCQAHGVVETMSALLADGPIERTVEWRHRPSYPVNPRTGQGDAHVQFAFCAHRAVVDVDVELGLVTVVELACAQDVGRAINPTAVIGQIQGGSVQGMGLALMEEVVLSEGSICNPSFLDYLIPTALDAPALRVELFECPDWHAPYGLRGVGELPAISSGPAVAAAVRAATGLALNRFPIRPQDLAGG